MVPPMLLKFGKCLRWFKAFWNVGTPPLHDGTPPSAAQITDYLRAFRHEPKSCWCPPPRPDCSFLTLGTCFSCNSGVWQRKPIFTGVIFYRCPGTNGHFWGFPRCRWQAFLTIFTRICASSCLLKCFKISFLLKIYVHFVIFEKCQIFKKCKKSS